MENTEQLNKIENIKRKKEKRSALKEFLPDDVLLEYGQNIKPHKWQFEGNLRARIHLKNDADALFFKALQYYNSQSLKEKTTELNIEKEKQKQEISTLVDVDTQLTQGLKDLAREGRWNAYAALLSTMAELGKATDTQLTQGLKDFAHKGWWDKYAALLSTMAELGKIDFKNPTYLKINKHIHTLPEDHQEFARTNIAQLLESRQSLETFHAPNGPYAVYQSLYEAGIRINNELLDETKKVRDPNAWWQNNSSFFGKLFGLDTKLCTGLVKERLAEGLPKFQGYISVYEPPLSDPVSFHIIKQALEKFSSPQELGTFLEITNAYSKANKLSVLQEIIDDDKSQTMLNKTASRKLLVIVAKDLGIPEKEVITFELAKWKTEFLPHLVSNDQMMKQQDMDEAQELYHAILKATFQDEFQTFLFDVNQEDEVGQEVAQHNAQVRSIFEQNSINYDTWVQYPQLHDFLVSTEVVIDKKDYYITLLKTRGEKVIQTLLPFKDIFTLREYDPLMHILKGAGNKKKLTHLKGDELKQKLTMLNERLNTLSKKPEYKDDPHWHDVFEHVEHLSEAIALISRKKHKEIESREKGFRIKVWDRDPKKDLFQGNYSQCCIAVGVKDILPEGGLNTHDPSTVMQFLADTGISVVEIYDAEKDNPIGNTWCFVSKNELGEPILVADNVELHQDYTDDPHVNNAIRDNLLSFLADYAQDAGLAGAGLGKVATNDIAYEDLPQMKVPPINTISGYLQEYTSDISNRHGRYYLETFNHQSLAAIHPERFSQEEKTVRQEKTVSAGFVIVSQLDGPSTVYPFTQELLEIIQTGRSALFSKADRDDLEAIEQQGFADLAQPMDELLDTLSNTKGVQMIIREKGKLVGYVSSRPAESFTYGIEHDPHFSADRGTLYLESVAGKIDPFETIRLIKEKAHKAGYKRLALYGLNSRLNKLLISAGFVSKHKVDNWMQTGKTAEYMEMELE
ncbi:hypothetical protein MYX07_02485 [Patescibacteria group bacterium AH-259-L07]|nr:hypothetical protein [Patescibacteria group bacterium AH-259-L07]